MPEINYCEKFINKKNMAPEEMKVKFLEHMEEHRSQGQSEIFTDGSKSADGVGVGIKFPQMSKRESVKLCFNIYSRIDCHKACPN